MRYLRQTTTGTIYVWTRHLASRKDMEECDAPQPNNNADPDKITRIARAICELDPANEDHYTNSGKPDVRVLASLLGERVSSDERDQALANLKER